MKVSIVRTSRITIWIAVAAMLTGWPNAFAQTTESTAAASTAAASTLPIGNYVEQTLSHSGDLESAVQNTEQALEAYENAQMSQESAYNLGLLENNYLYKQAELISTESSIVELAFHRVFSSIAAEKSFIFAQVSEEVAAIEYARAEELLKKEYISTAQERSAHMAYLQTSSNARNAQNGLRAVQKTLIRPISHGGLDFTVGLEIAEFDMSVPIPEIPELDWIVDHDPYAKKLRADLALYVERRDFLEGSRAASPAEIEAIVDTIEQAQQLLQQRIWALEDGLDQLYSDIEGNELATMIAELNLETKSVQLQQTQHQYDNGDIYASVVTQAELSYDMALEQLAALERSRFLLVLEAYEMKKQSLKEWVGKFL